MSDKNAYSDSDWRAGVLLTCEEREARLYWLKTFFMADTAPPA